MTAALTRAHQSTPESVQLSAYSSQPHAALLEQNPIDAALHHEPSAMSHQSAPAQQSYDPIRDFIRRKLPPWAYGLSSCFHMITSGILYLGKFTKGTRDAVSLNATRFTKFINSLVYTDLAFDAFHNKFSFDFLGRIAEPIMNIFVDLNHYHLFRSFSSALNQLHTINLPRVGASKNLRENFIANINASMDFVKEVWGNGGVKSLLKGDFKGFTNNLFGGVNDKGHTLALASHLQLLVGSLALLNGNKRNLLNRVLGIGRNLVGICADFGMLFEKDPSAKHVGIFYLLHAIGDTAKRFVSYDLQDLIDNLIMPLYNAALYNFGLMTRRQVDGEYLFHGAAA